MQAKGAIHEIAFPAFLGWTEVVVLLLTVAAGLVSAMILIFVFKNLFKENN